MVKQITCPCRSTGSCLAGLMQMPSLGLFSSGLGRAQHTQEMPAWLVYSTPKTKLKDPTLNQTAPGSCSLDGKAGRKVGAELMEFLMAAACVTPETSPSTHQMFATSIPHRGAVPAPGWAHPAQKHGKGCWVLPPAPTTFGDSPSPAPHRCAGSDFD